MFVYSRWAIMSLATSPELVHRPQVGLRSLIHVVYALICGIVYDVVCRKDVVFHRLCSLS